MYFQFLITRFVQVNQPNIFPWVVFPWLCYILLSIYYTILVKIAWRYWPPSLYVSSSYVQTQHAQRHFLPSSSRLFNPKSKIFRAPSILLLRRIDIYEPLSSHDGDYEGGVRVVCEWICVCVCANRLESDVL